MTLTPKIENKHTANDKVNAPKCVTCKGELIWRNDAWRCMFSRCPEYGLPVLPKGAERDLPEVCNCGVSYIPGTARCPVCTPPDIVEITECHNAGINGRCGPDCDAYLSQLECVNND